MKSKFFSLTLKDFIKGSVVAIITGILTALSGIITPDDIDFKKIGIAAIISFLAYLTKNLFTNSNDKFLKTENHGK
jgi:hypothetical protein